MEASTLITAATCDWAARPGWRPITAPPLGFELTLEDP